jgi:hypothetical protein
MTLFAIEAVYPISRQNNRDTFALRFLFWYHDGSKRADLSLP